MDTDGGYIGRAYNLHGYRNLEDRRLIEPLKIDFVDGRFGKIVTSEVLKPRND